MTMDIHDILKRLPHRYPFLMVDRVIELEHGKRIVALKNVTINEPYFVGHFPLRPVMPGVMMLEALAQAAALLSFDALDAAPDDKRLYYFAGIDAARFKRPVEPGDQLMLDVTLDRMKSGIFKFTRPRHRRRRARRRGRADVRGASRRVAHRADGEDPSDRDRRARRGAGRRRRDRPVQHRPQRTSGSALAPSSARTA